MEEKCGEGCQCETGAEAGCEGGSCGSECESKCDCGSGSCCESDGCGSGHPEGGYDHTAIMMYLAKSAKMELIKEKVKAKLEKTHGKKFDKVADILVEALEAHMKMKKEMMKKGELTEKLMKAFSED
ncbi:hypothetical protein HY988_04335 [Candidatus Micrarchaeota archaeon]|nr:hypothetical protein [Candidatus Micrarchaeota archaeon]